MPRTHQFRFRAPAGRGGLAADLAAKIVWPPVAADRGMIRLHRRVLLSLPKDTYWKDAAWMSFGASLSAPLLADAHPAGLLIEVLSLDYPLEDYRSEVAALAVDGWLHEEFDIPPSGAGVTMGAEGFAFAWGDQRTPFADSPGR